MPAKTQTANKTKHKPRDALEASAQAWQDQQAPSNNPAPNSKDNRKHRGKAPAQAPPPAKRSRPGRPPVLDDAKADRIVELLGKGVYPAPAAEAVGVNPATLHSLLRRYDHGAVVSEYQRAICRRIKMAIPQLHERMLERIAEGKPGWQGAAWVLERRFPDLYALRQRLDINATVRELRELSERDLDALAAKAAQALQGSTLELGPGDYGPADEGEGGTR